jgi:hypothetical protein
MESKILLPWMPKNYLQIPISKHLIFFHQLQSSISLTLIVIWFLFTELIFITELTFILGVCNAWKFQGTTGTIQIISCWVWSKWLQLYTNAKLSQRYQQKLCYHLCQRHEYPFHKGTCQGIYNDSTVVHKASLFCSDHTWILQGCEMQPWSNWHGIATKSIQEYHDGRCWSQK